MPMRGLTIIIAEASEPRLRTALGLALSTRALDGEVRLFFDTAAVSLVRSPIAGAQDVDHIAAGLPNMADLVEETLEAGVAYILCQAGIAMFDLSANALDARFTYGGMIGLLADLGEDRLVVV